MKNELIGFALNQLYRLMKDRKQSEKHESEFWRRHVKRTNVFDVSKYSDAHCEKSYFTYILKDYELAVTKQKMTLGTEIDRSLMKNRFFMWLQ